MRRNPPTSRRLTWEELVRLEPRLAELLAEARAVKRKPGYCPLLAWYGSCGLPGFRSRLVQLVGRFRPDFHPLLSSSSAYDVGYQTVYRGLPSCRARCHCL